MVTPPRTPSTEMGQEEHRGCSSSPGPTSEQQTGLSVPQLAFTHSLCHRANGTMKDEVALLATVTLLGVLLQGDLSAQGLPRVAAAHHRPTRVRARLPSPGRRPCAAWSTCSRVSATSRATRAPRSSGEDRTGSGAGPGKDRGWAGLLGSGTEAGGGPRAGAQRLWGFGGRALAAARGSPRGAGVAAGKKRGLLAPPPG
ncbi:leukotriene C4 synthase isoform X5 [Nomascus leucogenys]|uniref:leukotriene C4 synthase isoform X5 n=1 Tax=Nomascus leucogenys TaxID=61853 RepID=UPI00122DC284|nr:leukotriene C4 synthase isoform X5 [Nomascus leucogenys]